MGARVPAARLMLGIYMPVLDVRTVSTDPDRPTGSIDPSGLDLG